ncbi:MAG: leucine-rich repeat domain-containing protein, partial [Eubacterium sp.]|nr:leucine-rich repeat domain-containing protein [Eubacterium sp.]
IEIKRGSFCGCESLSDVKFNSKLKKIGALAFNFTGLKEIKMPDSVEECGWQCFCSSSLEKIQFSKKMTSLPGRMCCCTNIKSVIIPGNIKKIGNGVFEGCPLERVELQEGVEIVDLQSIVGKSNNENIAGRIKVTYDMVEVLVPESLKKMHIIDNSEYYKEEVTVTVSCSKDSAFTDEKVVEIPKNSSTIDISQLRSDADVYCKFEKIRTSQPAGFGSCQYIVPYHFVFK